VLDEALAVYRRDTWEVAYGSSGTIGAVGEILAAAGRPAGRITRADLDWLQEQLLRAQSASRVRLDGLKEDRRPVIGGGISVLRAVFDLLDINTLNVAQGALRQGVLYDLLDREQPETDLRSTTIQGLMQRFAVDRTQAQRVAQTACTLCGPLTATPNEPIQRQLAWAAQLHELGCSISHSDYHRHGAYILDHTDAGGFAAPELHRLAQLVLGHRGKLRKLDDDLTDATMAIQLLCLRLAVILCHARRDPDMQAMSLARDKQRFVLTLREGWSGSYPQSAYLLREEVTTWQKTPWDLVLLGA
jgi:exopolyphosphatase/guanosine-5'-triphosphate,3'-diphosphate pyrophosphatase